MNTINDGGPAFPVSASTGDPRDGVYCRDGMSLRDWFAGQVLCGAMVNARRLDSVSDVYLEAVSVQIWRVADAMLKARGQ